MIFRVVKRYYDAQIYSEADVGMFVKSGRLTSEEYKTITGQDYTA